MSGRARGPVTSVRHDANPALAHLMQEAVRLEDVVPLAAPRHVQVDVSNVCNFRCRMCPTGDLALLKEVGRPRGFMDPGLFSKILGDLVELGGVASGSLYADGEPLLHPQFATLARAARSSGAFGRLTLTTNGSKLDAEAAELLVETGFDQVRVSMYGLDDAQMAAVTRQSRHGVQDALDAVAHLRAARDRAGATRPLIYLKLMEGLADEAGIEALRARAPGADWIGEEAGHDWDGSFDLTARGKKPRDGVTKVCPKAWYTLNIASNGDVRVCCVDWSHDTTIGNVREDSLAHIWSGDRMMAFREMQASGDRSSVRACSRCTFFQKTKPGKDLSNLDRLVETDRGRLLSRPVWPAG